MLQNGLSAFFAACGPLLLAKDVAHVSSLCDILLNRINSLRLEWTCTEAAQEIHQVRVSHVVGILGFDLTPRSLVDGQRTYPLQFTLHNLNDRQGLGFRVFTKVIDRKT